MTRGGDIAVGEGAAVAKKKVDPRLRESTPWTGRDGVLDPLDKVWHLGVDAELALLAAPLAERGHPEHRPPPGGRVLAQQRPS